MNESTARATQNALALELPAPPLALLQLAVHMAEPNCDSDTLAEIIEADMALGSALLKTVNSAFFKLAGRVQTVREAITYLGHREVSAITLQNGLRAAFPPAPELEAVWVRATERSRWMGVVAQALGFDAWAAHSAGLFEECGKALLFRHAPSAYRSIWAQASVDDASLVALEMQAFGASHDILGAALCETWGLQAAAVHSVRHHVEMQATLALAGPVGHRRIAAVSVLAHHASEPALDLERCIETISQQLDLPSARVKAAMPSPRLGPAAST